MKLVLLQRRRFLDEERQMANDPRFNKSRFSTGVKRANTTDPRYAPSVRQGAPEPRRYAAEGRAGDTAFRKACFAESAERNQYAHADKIVIAKSPFAREE
jgi:hypothetical protein